MNKDAPNYGNPILDPGPFSRFSRLKNGLVSRGQGAMLDAFGWLARRSNQDQLAARAARRWIGSFLYSIKIEVNAVCKLRCRMCYVKPSANELPFDLVMSLFRDLAGARVRVEILGGEPLQRPDIVDIVSAARQVARAPYITLYTNATEATPDLCARLATAGLDAAIVTLVSHDAAVHDAFCGKEGAWAATVRGIEEMRCAGIEVYTLTAVHRENLSSCAEIHHFVKKTLKVHATFFQYVPQKAGDSLMISPQEWKRIKSWILLKQDPEHMRFFVNFCLLTGNSCSGGNFVLTVKADGSVQPCPFVSDLPLGDLHRENIWSIYANRYSAPGFTDFKRLPDECESCAIRSVCGGGCRASGRLLFGSWNRRDHKCLGPFAAPFDKDLVADCIPTFF